MKRYKVRFTPEAEDDLLRLYDFLLDSCWIGTWLRQRTPSRQSKEAIGLLRFSPFSCRKALPGNSFLRELIIPFGSAGYVALFEIEPGSTLNILAVRHQREEDYQ